MHHRLLGLELGSAKLASTMDEADMSAIVGGGVGASLPLIAAGQDFKRGLDLSNTISNLDKSRFVSHSKLKNLQRLGDFGLTMKDYSNAEMSPLIKFLAGNSARSSGTGFGHGVLIGPKGKVFHGGNAFLPSDLKIPKSFEGSRIPSLSDLTTALETTTGFTPSKLLDAVRLQNKARTFIETPEGKKEISRLFKQYLRGGPGQMVESPQDFAAVFRPTKGYTAAEKDLLKDYLKNTFHGNYNAPKAIWAGTRNILFPKIDMARAAKTMEEVCDLTGHCGSVPAGAAQLLGIARRGTRNVLPADIVNNPNLELAYIAGRGKPAQIKETVLKLLNKSMRERALAGVGAAVGLGGAGALLGKKLPPSKVLQNLDSGLSSLRNFISSPLRAVANII